MNTEQSGSHNISRKHISSKGHRNEGDGSQTPSRSNVFNIEIDNYKERIQMLQ
jgi:hypothetical protein